MLKKVPDTEDFIVVKCKIDVIIINIRERQLHATSSYFEVLNLVQLYGVLKY